MRMLFLGSKVPSKVVGSVSSATKLSEKLMGSAKTGETRISTKDPALAPTQNLKQVLLSNNKLEPIQKKSESANSEVKKQGAKEYLAKAVSRLTPAEYGEFQKALRGFKKGELDIEALVHHIRALFATPSRVDLLEGFITFVPKKHQDKCKPLLSAGSVPGYFGPSYTEPDYPLPNPVVTPTKRLGYDLISGQPLRPTKKPKLNNQPELPPLLPVSPVPPVSFSEKDESKISDPEPTVTKTGCPICRNNVITPFTAKCGHVCCHTCWQQWLQEKLECPVCREKTRFKQLTKLYFM